MSGRPGWGVRHPDLQSLLDSLEPAAVMQGLWGPSPLRIRAYTQPADLPDEIVTSVRCIVDVPAGLLGPPGVVVCENRDGEFHIWPGGRREAGETFLETAAREVHEETGWRIDPDSAERLGWLHLEHLRPQPPDHPYPHPDFLQVVFRARATARERPDWTDVEGYEVASQVMSLHDARKRITDPMNLAFLALLDL